LRFVDAPRFQAGFTAGAVLGVAMISLTILLRFLQKRDERKRAIESVGIEDVETSSGVRQEGISELKQSP
jgi:ACS family pantothenate transporter-like MFS transporter